ncbi:response regulator transcription factor [Massilia soli]|uniref:Response regulator transcription factor n=1 Tax=Massilia soli TaxID=2792854 RepID=A0ABS7STK6_9BURK|nr:response regulator transcription factor [Massilia soli]MBZ2209283.1 response regulator transcription factor [Massilia soli]
MTSPDPLAYVLVIEDDEHISSLLRLLLKRQGYRVQICRDGRDAGVVIDTADVPPALILLDVMLPYVGGFELVHVIRARADWDAVPIVMLTAQSTESDIVRALDKGANDYIIKPFQPNDLMARLGRFLEITL